MRCPSCGATNSDTAKACASCGKSVDPTDALQRLTRHIEALLRRQVEVCAEVEEEAVDPNAPIDPASMARIRALANELYARWSAEPEEDAIVTIEDVTVGSETYDLETQIDADELAAIFADKEQELAETKAREEREREEERVRAKEKREEKEREEKAQRDRRQLILSSITVLIAAGMFSGLWFLGAFDEHGKHEEHHDDHAKAEHGHTSRAAGVTPTATTAADARVD